MLRMDKQHPRWQAFIMTLFCPLCCNFHDNEDGKMIWNCTGQKDRPYAHKILEAIGDIDIPASMAYFDENGGFCDCEIVFNVAS